MSAGEVVSLPFLLLLHFNLLAEYVNIQFCRLVKYKKFGPSTYTHEHGILFFTETSHLQDQTHVEILQDQTLMMLFEHSRVRHNLRFGKLLMLLKSMGCFKSRMTEKVFFERFLRRGTNLAQNLISEMLD